jgi:leader peptidase (prepilin peptidase) / N-methyltransferase
VTALLIGLAALLAGPLLHGLAVQAGSDSKLHVGLTCPSCGQDGTPLSWRCACGRPRWREIALGVGVGLAAAGMTRSVGVRPVLIAFLAMVAVTAILIVTDLDHFRIPNRILYPGTAVCFVLLAAGELLDPEAGSLVRAIAGAGIYFGLLLLVFIAARGEGFGFGDVKLAALLGMFSAFQGYRILAWSLIITAVLGAIPAVVLLMMGKGKKASLPYGPPLILGAWSAIIFSSSLLT